MTQAEQIAGYLKLTRAHFLVIDRIYPSPTLAIRSEIVKEMTLETLLLVSELKEQLTPYRGVNR